ncbi:2-keto-3-deoxy-L-rhamnonate aldolase RhmA [Neorhizobium sp. 2083]|uniref:HpcH/HpaI aldolase family protein n=1 Tax=Neorhizobium sp. 2083 TaxID=2817762 RepID=UPI00285819A6|nr:aldolase/citrate lyase family protein [Neorhizobium sp. 2083]MDR6816414.1 2-keto-3-deoxy-L-rhamnonate aldolase RhmA [Neorhizobium sp. 2083]
MPPTEFTARFKARQQLLGAFVKTPTSHASEILGGAGFDFVVIDEEHAPIDRSATDQILLGCRVNGIAGLVRVPSSFPASIQSVLDCGANGVLVPHVASVETARAVVAASRYRGGIRGFSNSPRAGAYGATGMWDHIEAQDRDIAVLAMIEDREAIDVIEDILAVEGLDGIFIGRGDLTVSLGARSASEPVVKDAVARILSAARNAGKPVCVMVGSVGEIEPFRAEGASAFIVSSDQGILRTSAARIRAEFNAAAIESPSVRT